MASLLPLTGSSAAAAAASSSRRACLAPPPLPAVAALPPSHSVAAPPSAAAAAAAASRAAARSRRQQARRDGGAVRTLAAAQPSEQQQQQQQQQQPPPPASTAFNVIPANGRDAGRSVNGIPPVMGAHLMASGAVAPLSTSRGAGVGVAQHQFQYPSVAGSAELLVHSGGPESLRQSLTARVLQAAQAAVAERGAFTLVLSGGSLPALLSGLADPALAQQAQFDKWHVAYVDERNVPHASADSTHRACLEAFLGTVPIPPAQVLAIAEGLSAQQAATNYEGRLLGLPPAVLPREAPSAPSGGFPAFDLVLLGLGPDGHVASLFPNHPLLAVADRWVAAITDSPKPPPERITLTLPAINAAKDVVVVAAGEGKAEIVQRVLETQALPGALPAQLVRPTSGRLTWFVDEGSVQKLQVPEWDQPKAFPRNA